MRIHRAFAAAALTLGLVAAGAPAAQADPVDPPPVDFSACQFREGQLPDPVLAAGTDAETVPVYVRGSGCGAFLRAGDQPYGTNAAGQYLYVHFDIPGAGSYSTSASTFLESDYYSPNFYLGDLEPDLLMNSAAGKKLTGTIDLPDGTTRPFPGPTLTLKRKAQILDTYAPSKVKKNKRFFMVAVLVRADWNTEEDTEYFKQTLRLQSRPSGGKWKTIQNLNTGKPGWDGGTYAYTKIKKNTCFRWAFDGSSTTSAVTSDSECVKIKK